LNAQPLEIYRVSDNGLVASIDWEDKPTKAKVEGLGGRKGKELISNGLMDAELKWKMADGSMFEWDGVWGYPFVRFHSIRAEETKPSC